MNESSERARSAAELPAVPTAIAVAHETRYAISESAYAWSARLFSMVRRLLRVNVRLHREAGQLRDGDIFLFNHFARFETFIPQYLLYERIGAYSRAVASAEFFTEDDALGRYLRSVGAVPNDMPGLLSFLAAEILRGRKVVVFPEGGMVKDRSVLDALGEYSVYSRTAGARRKHHSGPAVLALILDAFKTEVRRARREGATRRIEEWAAGLGLPSAQALLAAAERPTRIVPCNITFYPIRVDDNLLRRGAELLSSGLSRRATEELLVEGNILLRDTDMDIRLGEIVEPSRFWGWWERKTMARIARRFRSLDDFFTASRGSEGWVSRVLSSRVRARVLDVRNEYMLRMYQGVTVNLSHLASSLILALLDDGVQRISEVDFKSMLYDLVKRVQGEVGVHLHHGLRHPDGYRGLIDGECAGFEQFMGAKTAQQLIRHDNGHYLFQDKLRDVHAFDDVRLENLVVVYANEVAPIAAVARNLDGARRSGLAKSAALLAHQRFDDELRAHALDAERFREPRYAEINARERVTEPTDPFLLVPDAPRPLGVLLVHGFLASPAEMRGLGEALLARGHTVMGVRLSGHGTSPWDLHERPLESWLESVVRGQRIMAGLTAHTVVVGFSTGGSLALLAAAQAAQVLRDGAARASERAVGAALRGIVAINVPMRFRDRRMMLVPIVHGANTMFGLITGTDGVMPFQPNDSEHPEVNYATIPVRGLRELTRCVSQLEAQAPGVEVPVCIIQGSADPVVDPHGAEQLETLLSSARVERHTVEANRHAVVLERIGATWEQIFSFVERLERALAETT